MGGEELKREDHRTKHALRVVHPNYMSGQAWTNLGKVVRETEESDTPKEPKGQLLLGGLEIDHQGHNAESRRGKEKRASEDRRKFLIDTSF